MRVVPAPEPDDARPDTGDIPAAVGRARRARLGSLGRRDAAVRAVPDRWLAPTLAPAVRQAEGLGRRKVTMRRERRRFALMAQDHRVDVLALDAVDVADLDGG